MSAPAPTARKRCPTVLQMEAAECGAAALAMVLAHHRLWVPLEELRIACGVSRDGSKASNLVRAARAYRMTAKGWRVEADEVGGFPLPAILFWEFNHFVVLEGIGAGKVYLNDPATGPRAVDFDDFAQSFTGVMLTFEPGPEFRPQGRPRGAWGALAGWLEGSGSTLTLIALASLLLVVPGIVLPAFARILVDDILAGGLTDWLKPLLIGLGVTALARAGLSWLRESQLSRLRVKLGVDATTQFVGHLLRLPMSFFAQRQAGDLAARVNASERLAQALGGEVAGVAFDLITLVFYAAVMALYDGPLTLVGGGLALVELLVLRWVGRGREDAARQAARDETRLMATSLNTIRSIETLKAMGAESDAFITWAGQHAQVMNGRLRLETTDRLLNAAAPMLAGLSGALVLGYGGWRVMEGEITLGTLVAFQSLLASFSAPIQALVAATAGIRTLKGDLERVDDVLRQPIPDAALDDRATDRDGVARLAGAARFENVTFGHSPLEPPLIENLNLRLEPGGWMALVGRSGSGKSTIARLLTGVHQPWSGEILLDGRPLAEVPRAVLGRSLASVSQEIFLFEGRVRDNLTLWNPTISESQLVAAATEAGVHDAIAVRPGGYDGAIAEDGGDLSGGEAQRLALARALAGEPSLLVLDEATSALDPLTEERILANLRRRGVSVVIIAHRLSTIRDCDEILVLDEGRVVQRGRHDDLIAMPGAYAELIRAE